MTIPLAPSDRIAGGAYNRMHEAWQWLCGQRTQAPDDADIWHIRWAHLSTGEDWLTDLTQRVLRGEYRLAPLQLHGKNTDRKAVWGAQDALVLKWVALSLQGLLPLHPGCEHVKGHGGGNQSIDKLHVLLTRQRSDAEAEAATDHNEQKKTDAAVASGTAPIPDSPDTRHYKWVCRTDIRGYYRNISKQTLISQVNRHVESPVLRDLVAQYVHYTVEDGGTFHTPEKGISRGCPLSPLMGALHLYDMDEHFGQQKHIHYARYMDDVIILAKSRWQLRKHTKRLMQWFSEYDFEAHPDKTFIGRTERGFDWMGAWLTHEGVTDVAPRAKANHSEKVRRLYELLVRLPMWMRKIATAQVNAWVSAYRKRWNIWAEHIAGTGRRLPQRGYKATTGNYGVLVAATLLSSAAHSADCTIPPGTTAKVGAVLCTAREQVPSSFPFIAATDPFQTYGGVAAWFDARDGAQVDTASGASAANGNATVVTTTSSRACGLGVIISADKSGGVTLKETYSRASSGVVNASWQGQCDWAKGSDKTVCGSNFSGNITSSVVSLGPAGGKCSAGTVVATYCTSYYKDQSAKGYKSGGFWSASSGLNSCGSTKTDVKIADPYVPPVPAVCTMTVTLPSPQIPDAVNDTSTAGKGTIMSIGSTTQITSNCTAGGKTVSNAIKLSPYSSKGGDFPTAGYDTATNTYIGLITTPNILATLGSVVKDSDLWSGAATSASSQSVQLAPIVIKGSTATKTGIATVTATVTSVAP